MTTADRIALVIASDDPAMTAALQGTTPTQVMDAIVAEGLTSDFALAAYDLLHAVSLYGRAW
jgi:hypothetical protein